MSQPSIKLSMAQPSEPILAASSNGTHHVCSAWVPDLPQLPPAVLFLNLGKHFRRAFLLPPQLAPIHFIYSSRSRAQPFTQSYYSSFSSFACVRYCEHAGACCSSVSCFYSPSIV